MKRLIYIILPFFLLSAQLQANDCLTQAQEEMNDMYRTGCGCEDVVYKEVSTSMIGWGVGLFIGIALLTGLVSSDSPATSTNDNGIPAETGSN